jgi:hypothetical protein
MPKTEKTSSQSRVFTASLKPAWSREYAEEFAQKNKGNFETYVVNHNRDTTDEGELIEEHTHVVIIYSTPRKISLIANILNVAPNFIEKVGNKIGMLRYLTHQDQPKKFLYPSSEVITNSIPYEEVIKGATMSDKEILEYVLNGKEFELIGVVSMSKIRLAQSLVHNKRLASAEVNLALIRDQNAKLQASVEVMSQSIERIDGYFSNLVLNLTNVGQKAQEGIIKIAEEIKRARLKVR